MLSSEVLYNGQPRTSDEFAARKTGAALNAVLTVRMCARACNCVHCAGACRRARPLKIVFRQHRPKVDIRP